MRITSDWLLDSLHIWGTFLLTILVSFLSLEGGFWFGRRKRRQSSDEQEVLVRTMVGGAVSLLAFVLAVTFWVAATHFDAARQSLLNNANAIRAAYLQADLLPQPYRTEIRNLLREYVDVRLEALRSGNIEQGILIADLDHPRSGVFRLSERALVDVRNMMGATND